MFTVKPDDPEGHEVDDAATLLQRGGERESVTFINFEGDAEAVRRAESFPALSTS